MLLTIIEHGLYLPVVNTTSGTKILKYYTLCWKPETAAESRSKVNVQNMSKNSWRRIYDVVFQEKIFRCTSWVLVYMNLNLCKPQLFSETT